MRISDTKKIKAGDTVVWRDPGDGACSRRLSIKNVTVTGNEVYIEETSGSVVECYARELGEHVPASE